MATIDGKKIIIERYYELANNERGKLSKWLEEHELELLEDVVMVLLSRPVTEVMFVFPKKYDKLATNISHKVADGDKGVIEITGVHSNTAHTLRDWFKKCLGEEHVALQEYYDSNYEVGVVLKGLDKLISGEDDDEDK